MPPDSCYWCGDVATTRDHVPPKSLFQVGKREGLITVPSCQKHNNDFKLLEERMKFYVQAASKSPEALAAFDSSTMRGLEDPRGQKLTARLFSGARPVLTSEGITPQLGFPPDDYKLYFEKIARGLYFLNLESLAVGEFFTAFRQSFVHHRDTLEIFALFAPHFSNPNLFRQPPVPYPEIFRYRYIAGGNKDTFSFATLMQFYSDFEVLATFHHEAGVSE